LDHPPVKCSRASRRNVDLRKAAYRGSIISRLRAVLPAEQTPGTAASRVMTGARITATAQPDIGIRPGAYVAIFSSGPSLPPDVPRTPGIRQTETQPAVSRHPAAEIPRLSRGHLSRGHTRTASTRPGRASYA
jgi:hypothetical protein